MIVMINNAGRIYRYGVMVRITLERFGGSIIGERSLVIVAMETFSFTIATQAMT